MFDKLKAEGKKAFSPFIMSGYPDYETNLEILTTLADAGADFIELGMPFSDPAADGPVIEQAGNIALKNGAKIAKTIDLVKQFRKHNDKTPIVWMGYYNPVYKYGIERFFIDASEAGIDGILLADLPPEEAVHVIHHANKNGVDVIHLITSLTPQERYEIIFKGASGFIYYVSVASITGSKEAQENAIKENVLKLKTKTELPVAVGFGINTPQKARAITEFADGAIVGSELIRTIAKHLDDEGNITTNKYDLLKDIQSFIESFVKAVSLN